MRNKILRKTLPILLLTGLLTSCGGYDIKEADNAGGSSFYEIFVGSFCDSNGDGTGDLKGIENKLDYLKQLGVSNLWLTPIHASPSYHKYDVKDYYSIDPKFGTMDDFESLVKSAEEHGMGIILDMVFNHTSIQSTWFDKFCEALKAGDKKSEYYDNFSWSEEFKTGYAYNAKAGTYVECNFDKNMPELNLDSKYVRAELKKIQDFWLDKGVAGFRYDAVKYYYCENLGGNNIVGITEKNVPFMKYLAESARAKKKDAYLVGENWVTDQENINTYASSGMNIFNFPTAGIDGSGTAGEIVLNGGPQYFARAIEEAQAGLAKANPDADLCVFVSNHDTDRWGGFRNGHDHAEEARKVVASAYLLTPGTPFIYYGEEIEMLGTRTSDSTDAERRQAMVWNDDSITCKQPEGFAVPKQVEKGVGQSLGDGWSMLNHYRKALSIRNTYKDVFRKGKFTAVETKERAVIFKIEEGGKTYYLAHNCVDKPLTLSLPDGLEILEEINVMQSSPSYSGGALTLQPYSSAFLR